MLSRLGIDRSLAQFGATAAVNDRARLRRRCCASSLTAAAAPKQGLAMRSMPGCASLEIRDGIILGRTLQDRSRWSDRSIPDARHSAGSNGLQEVAPLLGTRVAEPILAAAICAASTDRTYGRKRSDRNIRFQRLASRGPSTYGSRVRGASFHAAPRTG